jgi:hypothetical protein
MILNDDNNKINHIKKELYVRIDILDNDSKKQDPTSFSHKDKKT